MRYTNSIYESNLSNKAISVYLFLKDHSNKQKQCYHSIKSIASGLNISYKTVQRSLNELREAEWICWVHRKRVNGGNTSNLYTICK